MANIKGGHRGGNSKKRNHVAALIRKKEMLVDLLNRRKKPSEVADDYVRRYGISRTQIQQEFSEIIEYFRHLIERNYHKIAREHFDRYEEMFYYAKKVGSDRVAMRALEYKERLVGFHKEAFEIAVNNTNEQIATKTHDLSKLTEEERKRFEFLEKKMKKDLVDI